MVRQCPECGGDLVDLDPEGEMGSAPVRFWCSCCELRFESDASGLLSGVD